MELRQLQTFTMIASLGSFNRAAEALDLAQSTVSEQISNLEDDLRARLFRRDGRSSVLTPAGELVLRYARDIFDLESRLREELQKTGAIRGKLSIKMPETVSSRFLPPVLHEFRNAYPYVELTAHSCSFFGLAEELRSGLVNLAFLITDATRFPDLEARELGSVPLVVVTGPDRDLAGEGAVPPQALADEPFFAPMSDCDYFRILERLMTENQVRLSGLIRMNSLEGIRQNVREGNGSAILTRIAVEDDLRDGRMAEIPLETGPLEAKLFMLWQKNRWQPPRARGLHRPVRENFPRTVRVFPRG